MRKHLAPGNAGQSAGASSGPQLLLSCPPHTSGDICAPPPSFRKQIRINVSAGDFRDVLNLLQ